MPKKFCIGSSEASQWHLKSKLRGVSRCNMARHLQQWRRFSHLIRVVERPARCVHLILHGCFGALMKSATRTASPARVANVAWEAA